MILHHLANVAVELWFLASALLFGPMIFPNRDDTDLEDWSNGLAIATPVDRVAATGATA